MTDSTTEYVKMLRSKTLIRVSLVFLIIQAASCKWQPNNLESEPLCDSEECKMRGNLYKANMDDNVDPCQDFYTFTCGNWLKNQRSPKYSTDRSLLDVMNSNFNEIIRDTLESYDNKKGGNILFQKAKEVYAICVTIPEYPKAVEASDIAQEINKIGRLPKTHLWDIHSRYLKLTGESAFFRTAVIGEALRGDPVLIVMEPASAYGSIKHDDAWKPQEKQAYMQFLFQIIKSLNLPGSDAQINERIQKVFDFRMKFNTIIFRHLSIGPAPLNPLTAQELEKWFSDNLQDQTNTQDIPWVEVIQALYHKMPPRIRDPRKLIALRQQQYFIDLMELLKNQPEEVLAYHVEIYFIERHLKLNKNMYELLEGTSVEPHSLLRYIRERFNPRWETCIENHNMQEILEKMLYANEKWYQRGQYGVIHQLITDIKNEIYKLMNKAKWLEMSTHIKTLQKFYEIEPWVAFPPWVTGVGNRSTRDGTDILKPNAWLNMRRKWLYMTAPLLISPIFSPTIPAIYNYAGIGTTIGHELYHVIDNCGSYSDGVEEIVWWPEEARKRCSKRIESFVKAFNEITDREFKNRYNVVVKSNTARTVLEDYPDVMGLEVAYNVYRNSLNNDKSVCKTLPNFEEYNCDQMFYIAFGNSYCAHNSKKSALLKLESWLHSVENIRINGAVAQMESFGRAFNCSVGSPMNPQEKVNLWD